MSGKKSPSVGVGDVGLSKREKLRWRGKRGMLSLPSLLNTPPLAESATPRSGEEKSPVAQKMFGNRWTEIAKVVSGRTDNAVKNRFSTLCKKRAKFEASSKENSVPSLDPSNKRVLVEEPSIAILIGEPSTSNKQMGYHISPLKETIEAHRRSLGEHGPAQHLQRPPLLEV
ncbi:transcription factor MYB88-like [Zingiber officinale]|uniref:transcription factor MYB88-like n=1 Tax=Zingiber officinale TaxID=94328 RepID=UPI001C4AE3E4|nr:transcription factor MYB88-like [Zingiber officinale]